MTNIERLASSDHIDAYRAFMNSETGKLLFLVLQDHVALGAEFQPPNPMPPIVGYRQEVLASIADKRSGAANIIMLLAGLTKTKETLKSAPALTAWSISEEKKNEALEIEKKALEVLTNKKQENK